MGVVSKVKEMTGEIVWEYAEHAEREYDEGEYAEYAEREYDEGEYEQTTEKDQAVTPSYNWEILSRRRDIFSKRKSIGTSENCMTNREIRRRREEDECVDVWCPASARASASSASASASASIEAAYHEREETCYVFSDNASASASASASILEAAYHERDETCYIFSDNTCVVCTRVVFTGQCIFHK